MLNQYIMIVLSCYSIFISMRLLESGRPGSSMKIYKTQIKLYGIPFTVERETIQQHEQGRHPP